MDLGLKGKTCAVMAASEGIGRACAEALAREGADIAICGRREDLLGSTAKEIAEATGRHIVPIVADVADGHDVERFVNAAAADLRGLDVLVVNSGGPRPGRFEDVQDEDWRAAHDNTLMPHVRAIRHALPHFRTEHGGSVVGIGSTSVKQPIDNLLLSNSLRLAVVGLYKSLSRQYAPEKVRFNLVLPGMTRTSRLDELNAARAAERGISVDEAMAEREAGIPLGRAAEPEEVAAAVAWLAGAPASYVTGTAMQVDGGLTMSPL